MFLVGSVICATAIEPIGFIIGRGISGFGSSGGYVGTMVVMAHIAPLEKQTFLANGVGAVSAFGAVIGPLLGGFFTSEVCLPANSQVSAADVFLR